MLLLTSLVALIVLCCALPAFAQRNVDLERFVPATDARGFLGVQGTRTPGAGRATYGVLASYGTSLLDV